MGRTSRLNGLEAALPGCEELRQVRNGGGRFRWPSVPFDHPLPVRVYDLHRRHEASRSHWARRAHVHGWIRYFLGVFLQTAAPLFASIARLIDTTDELLVRALLERSNRHTSGHGTSMHSPEPRVVSYTGSASEGAPSRDSLYDQSEPCNVCGAVRNAPNPKAGTARRRIQRWPCSTAVCP